MKEEIKECEHEWDFASQCTACGAVEEYCKNCDAVKVSDEIDE